MILDGGDCQWPGARPGQVCDCGPHTPVRTHSLPCGGPYRGREDVDRSVVCFCLCVCVCMSACIYICLHVCMFLCMYSICMYVCTYVCVYVCMCVRTYGRVCVCVCLCPCVCVCVSMNLFHFTQPKSTLLEHMRWSGLSTLCT